MENGVVRILASTSYKGGPFTPADVIAGLKALIQKTDHAFWPDSLSILDERAFDFGKLTSGRITDSYLAALAHANNSRFVTLDATISIDTTRGVLSATVVKIV